LLDEAIELHVESTRDCGRSAGARAANKARGPCLGKVMGPCAEGRRRKRACVGARMQASAFDHFMDRLGAPEDTGVFRLLQHSMQGCEGVIGKVELEGSQDGRLQEKLLQKSTGAHSSLILLLEQRLFDSNFSGAALAAVDVTEL
jgi:hypothetical protein